MDMRGHYEEVGTADLRHLMPNLRRAYTALNEFLAARGRSAIGTPGI
jgi:hypothetical protein